MLMCIYAIYRNLNYTIAELRKFYRGLEEMSLYRYKNGHKPS